MSVSGSKGAKWSHSHDLVLSKIIHLNFFPLPCRYLVQLIANDQFWNSFLLSQDRQYSSYTEDHLHHKRFPHFYSSFLPLQLSSFLFCESSALPLDTSSEVNTTFCLNSMILFPNPSLFKAFIKQIMESQEYEVFPFNSFLPFKAVKAGSRN